MALRLLLAAAAMGSLLLLLAQTQETYKARLSAVPADTKSRPDITGIGSATAVLAGTKLTINGSFEGLKTAATTAQLHDGLATGVRGPVIKELTVSKAASGSVSGSFDLTATELEHLKKGRFYVQIHSEKAPEGNLWGWLLR